VARANVLASSAPIPSGDGLDGSAFNVATSIQRNVIELADTVGEVMGRPKPSREFAPPRPGELLRSSLDIRKARQVLGWTPEVSFDDGLRELVEWFGKEAR
jgi:UDP-glucose 4-epimerase